MASLIPNSFWKDVADGVIDLEGGDFKVMLCTSSYTPSASHDRRNDITNEVTGDGYTAGGAATTVDSVVNNGDGSTTITLGAASWPESSIEARYGVIYEAKGGASSADPLGPIIDFGETKISSAGTFALTASTITVENTDD